MDITISGEFAQRIMALTRKDRALALAFAQQLMASVEPAAISRFLLTREAALALLTERLRKHPEQTLAELRRLAEGRGVASARGA